MSRLTGRSAALLMLLASGAAAAFAASELPGAPGHRENPPLAHTGGFGEPTCLECHFDSPLNPEGGILKLSGVPAVWEPGVRYRLAVELHYPELELAGFELAVRYAEGAMAGQQAGSLEASGGRVAVTDGPTESASVGPIQYAHHTVPGSEPTGDGEATWTVTWTAPQTSGEPVMALNDGRSAPQSTVATSSRPVIFHVAANAANYDDSEFGDRIFAAQLEAASGTSRNPRRSRRIRD